MNEYKTKVILVTGFLGSGKTTVMKNLVELTKNTPELKIGIIINEFGKINVDAQTIIEKDIEITEINNGSIFCKCLEGTFVDHILALKDRKLDYLFIESSGLSDPSNMQSIMMHVNKFSQDAFNYAGTICVIDAKYFIKLSKSLVTIQRQIAVCNLCIINKIDLADDGVIEDITKETSMINPYAKIHLAVYGKLPANLFSDLNTHIPPMDMPSSNTVNNRPDVILLTSSNPLQENFIDDFIMEFKGKLLRLKGFARYNDGVYHIESVGDECHSEKIEISREQSQIVAIPFPGISIKNDVTEYLKNHPEWNIEVI